MSKQTTMHGVTGTMSDITVWNGEKTFKQQTFTSIWRGITGYGAGGKIRCTLRFDDKCHNKHDDFAITAEVVTSESLRCNDIQAGGCMHDEITRKFPEFAHLIKWHLVGTQGPMHYIANTTYHAGDRDHNGLLAYVPWCRIGEGKKRELDYARSSAAWPEATDEQLCLPKEELTKLLQARLPALLADFKADMLACGFVWSVDDMVQS